MTSNLTPIAPTNVSPLPERYVTVGKVCVLRKDIAAIQAIGSGPGRPTMGMMLRLPRGLQVELCGGGFSDQTVKVRTKEDFFFVLRRNVMG
jgi:hypothetical protein